MSVQSQINRLQQNVAAAYTVVGDRGGDIPEQMNSNNLPQAINTIPLNADFLVVKVDFNTYVASHSASEIRTAQQAGKVVITTDSYGMLVPLYNAVGEVSYFEAIYDDEGLKKMTIIVAENKSVTVSSVDMFGASPVGTVELLANNWVEDAENEYSQQVTVSGVPENVDIKTCQVDLTPSRSILSALHDKDAMLVAENENGVVTVTLIGQKFTNDYEVQVTLNEVKCDGGKIVGVTVGTSLSPAKIEEKINNELTQAKESGEFTGVGIKSIRIEEVS